MWQKCEAPWAGGCRVASGNKGKSVVIQLFPRDETVVGNSDGRRTAKNNVTSSLYFWPSHPRGTRGAEGHQDWCVLLLELLPFPSSFLSLSLSSSTFHSPPHSILLFSTATAPVFTNIPVRDPTRSSLIPANRRPYRLFMLVTSSLISLSLSLLSLISRDLGVRTMWFTHRHRLNYRPSS